MGNLTTILRETARILEPVSTTPRLDAELLMAHALGKERSQMLLRLGDLDSPDAFAAFVERRMQHEPVAYITGRQAFWDLDLAVTPDVLIPRSDSESLIEAAIEAFSPRSKEQDIAPIRVLDLGTGSGALLLACLSAFPQAVGTGIDASPAALGVAKGNAEQLGFAGRSQWLLRDWNEAGWSVGLEPFDLILCNPPYVETQAELALMVRQHEPHSALFAGIEGLDDYHVLIPQIPALLKPAGFAIFEIGYTQSDAVSDLASNWGLSTELRRDLAGNPRALRFSLGIGGMNG